MKFAHLADCHLGGWRQPELQQLNLESFKKAISICLDEKVEFVLFAGDLFDSAYPSIEVLKETFSEFKRLKEAKRFTKVEIKFLPEEVYMQMVWTLFGDNLLILIYEPEIIALRIKSEPIVKTFSSQFDYLWKKHNDKKNR